MGSAMGSAMGPAHTLAWILLLAADWLRTVHTRDFTSKDIVLLYPSAPPYPGALKCFTCKDAADNYECNRWAPDVYCPRESRYCYTRHTVDTYGDSVSVTKRCVTLDECLSTGCEDVTGHSYQVCSSCCEGNICNLPVPRNTSSTILSSSSPMVSSGGGLRPVGLSSVIIISIFTARQMEVN